MTQRLNYTTIAPAGVKAGSLAFTPRYRAIEFARSARQSGLSARLADQRLCLLHRHAFARPA